MLLQEGGFGLTSESRETFFFDMCNGWASRVAVAVTFSDEGRNKSIQQNCFLSFLSFCCLQ